MRLKHLGMYHISYLSIFIHYLYFLSGLIRKVIRLFIVSLNNWSSYYMFSIWYHKICVDLLLCACDHHNQEVHHGGDTTLATELNFGGEASLWWLFRYKLSQALFWFMWNPLNSNFSLKIWQHPFANLTKSTLLKYLYPWNIVTFLISW